jgi:hypothetical protein
MPTLHFGSVSSVHRWWDRCRHSGQSGPIESLQSVHEHDMDITVAHEPSCNPKLGEQEVQYAKDLRTFLVRHGGGIWIVGCSPWATVSVVNTSSQTVVDVLFGLDGWRSSCRR